MSQRDRAEKKAKAPHGSGAWHSSKAAEKAQRATVKVAKRAHRRLDDAIVEDERAATSDSVGETNIPTVIRFYSVTGEYGEFSNFAHFPIVVGRQVWKTSEHYFQAQKFKDPKDVKEIRTAKTPMLAARMGRDRKRKLRRDWESSKVSIMRVAVGAKFRQHEDLALMLLATGTAKLVEHTENDSYWGDGGDGSGKNMLGQILMALRSELAIEQGQPPTRLP